MNGVDTSRDFFRRVGILALELAEPCRGCSAVFRVFALRVEIFGGVSGLERLRVFHCSDQSVGEVEVLNFAPVAAGQLACGCGDDGEVRFFVGADVGDVLLGRGQERSL